ncbi:MAG: hypothetical protein L7S72_08965, partial [Flavobacteriales bacterium]|nr:hypothetical protein [Flavobacteriales bacterium]
LKKLKFDEKKIVTCNHKPFVKSYLYLCENLNEEVNKMKNIFNNKIKTNKIIMIKNRWSSGQIAFMTDNIPIYSPDGGEQCFPISFDNKSEKLEGLFSNSETENELSMDCITDEFLNFVRSNYSNSRIKKIDIFHYIYGLLHSEGYLSKFQKNLSKDLPFIPLQKKIHSFQKYVEVGSKLAELHTNYEKVKKYPLKININNKGTVNDKDLFKLDKMKFIKKGKIKDLSRLHYNKNITIEDIPLETYNYIIYGKPALDWIVDRYSKKIDDNSGIENDPNDYSNETMNNPAYPLELLQKVVTVSLETQKLIKSLPDLDI